jgi:hypothetical protein
VVLEHAPGSATTNSRRRRMGSGMLRSLMEAFALGRRQKVEATIDGPRPQQQAKDTLSAKEKRAQTGA